MVAPVNIRFNDSVDARLRRFASRADQAKNSVVNTAVSEWLAMQAHPRVHFVQELTGERRAVLHDGPQVWVVAESWLAHEAGDRTAAVVADALGLSVVAVEAALGYWAENREEIDSVIERHRAAQDEALAAWQRRQALLGA
mgnify:CR=1 FL=1